MVMMESISALKQKSVADGQLVLTAMSDGKLAAQIAEQASVRKGKSILSDQHETASDDDDSEDEYDMNELRRKAKETSHTAAICGCLPPDAAQKLPKKTPFASLSVLGDAMEALEEILSKPAAPATAPFAGRICTPIALPVSEAASPEVNDPEIVDTLAPDCESSKAALPEEDGSEMAVTPVSPNRPVKPQFAKTATVRPARRKAAKPSAATSPKAASSPKAPTTPKTLSGKPPKPAGESPLSPSKSSKVRKPVKFATCYQIDTSGDELDVDTTSATVRESSLTRAYDALGVPHCSLDDGSDAEGYNVQLNKLSISASYEALGARPRSRPARSASPAGPLPPVRPASRSAVQEGQLPPIRPASRAASASPQPPPATKMRSGPSAMELDLGLCNGDSHGKAYDLEKMSAPVHLSWEAPACKLMGTRPSSKQQRTTCTLPALPGVKLSTGASLGTKSMTMMKSGSAGATLWNMAPAGMLMETNTKWMLA